MSVFETIEARPLVPIVEDKPVQRTNETKRQPMRNSRYNKGNANSDKISMEIDVGKMDGIEKSDLCEFLKDKGSLKSIEIGRITLNDQRSFVEIDKYKADVTMSHLSKCSFDGRPLRVRMMPARAATSQ